MQQQQKRASKANNSGDVDDLKTMRACLLARLERARSKFFKVKAGNECACFKHRQLLVQADEGFFFGRKNVKQRPIDIWETVNCMHNVLSLEGGTEKKRDPRFLVSLLCRLILYYFQRNLSCKVVVYFG
jgi:hypothetical protein